MSSSIVTRSVAADRGLGWIVDAFRLFMQAPLIWIAMILIVFVGMFVVSLVPLGGLLTALFGPVIYAGMLLGCERQQAGEALKFDTLFAGFQSPHLTRLILLGLLNMVAFFVLGLIAVLLIGGTIGFSVFTGGASGADQGLLNFGALFSVGMLVVLALSFLVMMGFWFATPLVALGGIEPLEAVKASFRGSLLNVGPFLIYGLLMLLAFIVALIPMGLGLIVLAPVGFIGMYLGYRDIYAREQVAASMTPGGP